MPKSRGVTLSGFGHYPHTVNAYKSIVHTGLMNKVKRLGPDFGFDLDISDATFLENCFNEIKQVVLSDDDHPVSTFLTESMIDAIRSTGFSFFNYLTVSSSNQNRGYDNYGEKFEYDMAKIVDIIATQVIKDQVNKGQNRRTMNKAMKSQGLSITHKARIGQKQAEVNADSKQALEYVLEKMLKDGESKQSTNTKLERKSIKTDIDFTRAEALSCIATYAPNPTLERFLDILSTKGSFTNKNYFTSTIEKFGISLGSAQNYKWFFAPLGGIGITPTNQKTFFYATKTHYARHSEDPWHEETVEHLNHIKFAYELMGIGQQINNVQMPLFLILNEKEDAEFQQFMKDKSAQTSMKKWYMSRYDQELSDKQMYGMARRTKSSNTGAIHVYSTKMLLSWFFDAKFKNPDIAFSKKSISIGNDF